MLVIPKPALQQPSRDRCPLLAQQTAQILPPLNVDKDKITFDPQTVAVGAFGSVHTGCEGAAVKITSREKGLCHFSYTTDGCGGVFGYYRGEVPVTAGLVTVENFNGGIRNSFPEKSLTLVRWRQNQVSRSRLYFA